MKIIEAICRYFRSLWRKTDEDYKKNWNDYQW